MPTKYRCMKGLLLFLGWPEFVNLSLNDEPVMLKGLGLEARLDELEKSKRTHILTDLRHLLNV